MSRVALRLATLLLPLIGLGALWFTADRSSREGTDWDVPVQGYDPRDLLQGHYVQFRYDWPAKDVPDPETLYGMNALCLEGAAPRLDSTRIRSAVESCPLFVRHGEADQGRLYASEARARRLQQQLWDQKLQGVIRIRVRADGHVTPLRLTFRLRAGGAVQRALSAPLPPPLVLPAKP